MPHSSQSEARLDAYYIDNEPRQFSRYDTRLELNLLPARDCLIQLRNKRTSRAVNLQNISSRFRPDPPGASSQRRSIFRVSTNGVVELLSSFSRKSLLQTDFAESNI